VIEGLPDPNVRVQGAELSKKLQDETARADDLARQLADTQEEIRLIKRKNAATIKVRGCV
jgi:glucose-6-phosphate-specific signal transduction histidine kinase